MTSLPHPHHNPMDDIERATERLLGADLRLLYGIGVPMLACIVTIAVVVAFAPSTATMVGLFILDAVVLGVVMIGFARMLNNDSDDGHASS